jgi:hypothetical protein
VSGSGRYGWLESGADMKGCDWQGIIFQYYNKLLNCSFFFLAV